MEEQYTKPCTLFSLARLCALSDACIFADYGVDLTFCAWWAEYRERENFTGESSSPISMQPLLGAGSCSAVYYAFNTSNPYIQPQHKTRFETSDIFAVCDILVAMRIAHARFEINPVKSYTL